MLKKLTCDKIHEFDEGSLAILVNEALRQIYFDLDNRPLLKKARKLMIQFEFVPRPEEGENTLRDVLIAAQLKTSVPNRETRVNVIIPAEGGGFEYNDSDPIARRSDRNQNMMPFDNDE